MNVTFCINIYFWDFQIVSVKFELPNMFLSKSNQKFKLSLKIVKFKYNSISQNLLNKMRFTTIYIL